MPSQVEIDRLADGIVIPFPGALLKLELVAEDVVRVAYARERSFFERVSLMAAPRRSEPVPFELKRDQGQATLVTSRLQARVDLATAAVTFLDAAGVSVLAERVGGKTLTPAVVQGESTFHVRQEWEAQPGEALYGLGQHQHGLFDIKGHALDLWQHNLVAAVPFLVSSRGYGILWDNDSRTRFGELRDPEAIPAALLFDRDGRPGGLSASYFAGGGFERPVASRVEAGIDVGDPANVPLPSARIHPRLPEGVVGVRWEGELQCQAAGAYVFETQTSGGLRLWLDDRLLIDTWRQGWLAWWDTARVRAAAGRHRLRVEWRKDQEPGVARLFWKPPSPYDHTSLWSEVGDGIDYYFVLGPSLGRVVAGYRRVTGAAPMMPVWAHGLWQSRERYENAQEVLDVLARFRAQRIPVDVIVQDWRYWRDDAWGSHEFDPERFPDPEGWVRSIHDSHHARLMLAVWPKFYAGTANFAALQAGGFLYQENLREQRRDWRGHVFTFYDAFNPEARRLYWSQIERTLVPKGIDAWWMDATEPEVVDGPTLEGLRTHMHPTARGTGSRVLNAYSLVNSQAVYEGHRRAAPERRVFILTRSAFAGQQRYAAATWSGDVSSEWATLRRQVPAGLSFSLSGIPYWTTDIGGFAVPPRFAPETATPEAREEWRELQTRWFQYGAFCPLFRVHGQFPFREMWELGGESSPAALVHRKFDRLRYRLLPYVYSLAGAVAHGDGTIMRPLVMDFPDDARTLAIGDQFLFGPALLVSPVTEYRARSREVYLPQTADWYDFWTGHRMPGGRAIEAAAPFDSIPVHTRAGAIVPMGPELQYTTEKPAEPIELRVYRGADGTFQLYEDDGSSYEYELGAFATIPIAWDERAQTLTIGERQGRFPGMLDERTFHIVWVREGHGVGLDAPAEPDHIVAYDGASRSIRAR